MIEISFTISSNGSTIEHLVEKLLKVLYCCPVGLIDLSSDTGYKYFKNQYIVMLWYTKGTQKVVIPCVRKRQCRLFSWNPLSECTKTSEVNLSVLID